MYQCSPYCFDRNCDRFNGTCLTGCTDNFYGEKCDKDVFREQRTDASELNCTCRPWFIVGAISLTINSLCFIGVSTFIWRVHTKKPGIFKSCSYVQSLTCTHTQNLLLRILHITRNLTYKQREAHIKIRHFVDR
ncbi:uncharacterized protein LOC111113457 [Crassostrea virginica]